MPCGNRLILDCREQETNKRELSEWLLEEIFLGSSLIQGNGPEERHHPFPGIGWWVSAVNVQDGGKNPPLIYKRPVFQSRRPVEIQLSSEPERRRVESVRFKEMFIC